MVQRHWQHAVALVARALADAVATRRAADARVHGAHGTRVQACLARHGLVVDDGIRDLVTRHALNLVGTKEAKLDALHSCALQRVHWHVARSGRCLIARVPVGYRRTKEFVRTNVRKACVRARTIITYKDCILLAIQKEECPPS
jgi:hypothetical protein